MKPGPAYGLAAVVMVCLVQGWVPANFWMMHSFQFGATIDMLLFMRVLGLRSRRCTSRHSMRTASMTPCTRLRTPIR